MLNLNISAAFQSTGNTHSIGELRHSFPYALYFHLQTKPERSLMVHDTKHRPYADNSMMSFSNQKQWLDSLKATCLS